MTKIDERVYKIGDIVQAKGVDYIAVKSPFDIDTDIELCEGCIAKANKGLCKKLPFLCIGVGIVWEKKL